VIVESRHPAGDADRPIVAIHRPLVWQPYHVLAVLPMLGLLGGVWFANRVEPYVLGLPFLLFWIVMWVVAASAIMWIIWALDRRRGFAGSITDLPEDTERRP
jgi:hypothetical protein